jgi:hypothetical protein
MPGRVSRRYATHESQIAQIKDEIAELESTIIADADAEELRRKKSEQTMLGQVKHLKKMMSETFGDSGSKEWPDKPHYGSRGDDVATATDDYQGDLDDKTRDTNSRVGDLNDALEGVKKAHAAHAAVQREQDQKTEAKRKAEEEQAAKAEAKLKAQLEGDRKAEVANAAGENEQKEKARAEAAAKHKNEALGKGDALEDNQKAAEARRKAQAAARTKGSQGPFADNIRRAITEDRKEQDEKGAATAAFIRTTEEESERDRDEALAKAADVDDDTSEVIKRAEAEIAEDEAMMDAVDKDEARSAAEAK